MTNCSFCGHILQFGSGTMYVKTDGKIFYFCSTKCEKNQLKLGRISKFQSWTDAGRKEKSDRMRQADLKNEKK